MPAKKLKSLDDLVKKVGSVFGLTPEEVLARAQLSAAAPDLFAALQALVDRYVQLASSGDCGNWDCEADPEVVAARAALAKASSSSLRDVHANSLNI